MTYTDVNSILSWPVIQKLEDSIKNGSGFLPNERIGGNIAEGEEQPGGIRL